MDKDVMVTKGRKRTGPSMLLPRLPAKMLGSVDVSY